MRREHIFLSLLVIFFAVIFTFGSRTGMYVQRLLTGPIALSETGGNLETLRATVEGYGTVHTLKGDTSVDGKTVPVYSRYPLNLKNELLIAAGANDGINPGDVAIFQGSILGTVEKVFADSALVQTVFDSRFKASVRIGSEGADALLVGGAEPKLTLIPLDSKVGDNDQVYTAGENMPYGTEIGALKNLRNSGNSLFKDASLKVFYNPATLDEVTVIPKPQ